MFKILELSFVLKGKQLQNFVSSDCFENPADFEAQTPSIYPLGEMKYVPTAGIHNNDTVWESKSYPISLVVNGRGVVLQVLAPQTGDGIIRQVVPVEQATE